MNRPSPCSPGSHRSDPHDEVIARADRRLVLLGPLLQAVHALLEGTARARIGLLDLQTGARTVLVRGAVGGVYAASGHLLYGVGDALLAAPFDLKRLRITGDAVPVVSDVALQPSNGEPAFSVSASGTLAYVRASVFNAPTVPEWVSRDGRAPSW